MKWGIVLGRTSLARFKRRTEERCMSEPRRAASVDVVELWNEIDSQRADLVQAQAERNEARLEAARWQGSFDGMVAVERELKTDLAKAVEGLRDAEQHFRVAHEASEADQDITAFNYIQTGLNGARSILSDLEGKGGTQEENDG